MIIKCHRKLTVNLKIFLETLGYECYFDRSYEHYDEILVLAPEDTAFLKAVSDYTQRWGFIPYHYSLKPPKKGKRWKEERIASKVSQKECKDFKALQGDFQLILFSGKDGNFVWKTYSRQDLPGTDLDMTAKLKAVIDGLQGEVLNLVSHCRLKENNK